MSKISHYLQEHLLGEVADSPEVRRYFSTDASILQVVPTAVVYPRNESDVRKVTRFCWQLAQRERHLPITPRGGGSNTSGAAIGSGIVLAFPAHMNQVVMFEPKKQSITVEPGMTYDKLQEILYSHGWFLAPYPNSPYSTIGGGIANNIMGEKSVKYGTTGQYVKQLRVVLSNGEVIEAKPLNKRELSHKLGLTSFEGQIYRQLDTLLEENAELLAKVKGRVKAKRNASGYNLFDIKKKRSFNLAPLFIGSQGSLGIITEAELELLPNNSNTTLALISLDELNDLNNILPKILELEPSLCDMMNRAAVEQINDLNPSQLNKVLAHPDAAIHLFLELDNFKEADQKKALKKLQKIVDKAGAWCEIFEPPKDRQRFWKIRQSISTILTAPQGQSRAVPIAEDVAVPIGQLVEFLRRAETIYSGLGLKGAAWGPAGDGVVYMRPALNLAALGDRQKLFNIADGLYDTAIKMGGSISASANDGRTRAPYIAKLYGEEFYGLMLRVKKIFDPYNLFNPGVKTTSLDDIKALMRDEYKFAHYEYLPPS